jgi:threonine dehydrogenase-like Zn-dependent dehydrogenase
MLGGYSGGQAEYLRVPMADIGPIKIPDSVTDEQALFLSDIFPTGYMAAVNAQIEAGDTVAIWGCGPVGQFAIRSALLLGGPCDRNRRGARAPGDGGSRRRRDDRFLQNRRLR